MEEDTECAICLSPFNVSKETLSCGHAFHKSCIQEWCRSSSSCPLCRKQFQLTVKRPLKYHIRCLYNSNLFLFESLPFREVGENHMNQLASFLGGYTVFTSSINVWFLVPLLGEEDGSAILGRCRVLEWNEINPEMWSAVAEMIV